MCADTVHCSPSGATLFYVKQLCMDAVRGFLPAHRVSVSIYIRTAAGTLANGLRMDITGHRTDSVWSVSWDTRGTTSSRAVSILCVFVFVCI